MQNEYWNTTIDGLINVQLEIDSAYKALSAENVPALMESVRQMQERVMFLRDRLEGYH